METRLETIKDFFQKEQKAFTMSISDTNSAISLEKNAISLEKIPISLEKIPISLEKIPISLETNPISLEKAKEKKTTKKKEEIEKDKLEVKQKVHKTPILLNKINKHRFDLEKNNMKRKTKTIECSGILGED